MNIFESNIISIYGVRGKDWLEQLPSIVENISKKHSLSKLIPINNLSYHYVMRGLQGEKPIILKLGLDILGLRREVNALKAFSGYGAAVILAEGEGLILLEQAVPGTSLKSYFPEKNENLVHIACNVMKQLHSAPAPEENIFPHMRDWLKVFDKNWDMPKNYLQKARQLRDNLLQIPSKDVLLHGDLHYDNILQNSNSWIIIDPKGVIGHPINELWAFIMDMEQDTRFVANYFGFNLQEVRDWYFVHLILAVCWNLEDNIDNSLFMGLAERAYKMISV